MLPQIPERVAPVVQAAALHLAPAPQIPVQLSQGCARRFRHRDEVADSLMAAGFTVDDLRDAPGRPGREMVFVARRPG